MAAHIAQTHFDETHRDDSDGIVISGDDARGGVTGHNARYVLAYGMIGIVASFAAVAIYFGFDRLQANVAEALSQNPSDVIRAISPYAAIVLAGTIGAGLLLSLWNFVAGRSEDDTQGFMRFRVVAQFAVICVIMAMLYVSAV
jgi:uncharacterized BrkB/YihY/UPF0761 family membrane protein